MINRAPLRDEVYRQVLHRIEHGDLAPGTRVRDSTLAEQLGVSRTPVREALLQLAADGALDAPAGRGFRVRPLDSAELQEVGEVLGALELLALRLSPTVDASQLDRLREVDRKLEATRGDVTLCLDLEDEWHRMLLERCPNLRLLGLIATLRRVPRRYLAAYMRGAGRLSLSTLPHSRIIDAMQRESRDDMATVFQHQWQRGIAELCRWAAEPTAAS